MKILALSVGKYPFMPEFRRGYYGKRKHTRKGFKNDPSGNCVPVSPLKTLKNRRETQKGEHEKHEKHKKHKKRGSRECFLKIFKSHSVPFRVFCEIRVRKFSFSFQCVSGPLCVFSGEKSFPFAHFPNAPRAVSHARSSATL